MSDSQEFQIESVLIAALNKDMALAAVGVKHHDEDPAEDAVAIKVSVIKGEQRLEGPQGFMFEARIEVQSSDTDAEQLSDLTARIDAAVETPDLSGVDLDAFTFLQLFEDASGDRTAEPDSRSRIRSYPIHAAFAA